MCPRCVLVSFSCPVTSPGEGGRPDLEEHDSTLVTHGDNPNITAGSRERCAMAACLPPVVVRLTGAWLTTRVELTAGEHDDRSHDTRGWAAAVGTVVGVVLASVSVGYFASSFLAERVFGLERPWPFASSRHGLESILQYWWPVALEV